MVANLPIMIDEGEIASFCREHGIRRLSLFGSVTRADFTPASDVDVLVEYLPGRHPGLMLFRQQDELSVQLRRRVDLHTPASLSKYFRADVLHSAVPVYEPMQDWFDADDPLPDQAKALLEARLADMEKHPENAVPWPEAEARLVARYGE